jgi:hypothetical protein
MISARLTRAIAPAVAALTLALAGCARDTRVNSDPGPGKPSAADGGDAAVKPASGPAATTPATGTDSTGRPSDASGGTTGAGTGSKTSGTATGSGAGESKSQPR